MNKEQMGQIKNNLWDDRFELNNIDDYIKYNYLNTWINSHWLSDFLKIQDQLYGVYRKVTL